VRWLAARGASVVVVMTSSAAEFVSPLTFETLSGNPVVTGMWGSQNPGFSVAESAARKMRGRVEHVDVAEAADALVIAPASANLMARLVHGEAPDSLTAIALATPAPLIVCPAMDLEMWRHPATQENVRVLRSRGANIVGPESGPLASGLSGPGRLASIDAIGGAVVAAVSRRQSLEGVRVLVGAGRTEEALDPVRVLTNRSSGRMGLALVEAARARGAEVTLVLGPAAVDPPNAVHVVRVTTATEMDRAMRALVTEADVVLMAAAVSDYRPARVARQKIKRDEGPLHLELVPNPDILAGLGEVRRENQVLVGFALETSDGVRRAREKRSRKGVDLIVLNAPADSLGKETNKVTLVGPRAALALPEMSKREVAEHVLDHALELWRQRAPRARRAASRKGSR
jgi:phosphopantothenoylcysteine decarboxylase/phosphopantothenate--cysteine ligase